MATKIILKKSSTIGAIPLSADLEIGEVALNLADRKLYTKDNSNNVIQVGHPYVGAVAPTSPAEGDLWYDTTNDALMAFDGTAWQSAGYQNLSELEDVTLTTITSGDHLTWNGSAFVNSNFESDVEGLLSAANTGTGYGDLSYINGVYTFDRVTAADIRSEVSVVDAGGDGSLAYDSGTGVITYTGPSAAEVQAHFAAGTNTTYSSGTFDITDATIRGKVSATDAGGDGSFSYDSNTGVFTYTGPSAAEVRAHFSGGTGVDITSGVVSIGQPVATTDTVQFAEVQSSVLTHTGGTITIDPTDDGANTGTVVIAGNLTVNGTTTSVNSNEVNIGDSVIVLNADEAGTPSQDGGIEIERGTATNVSFVWDETNDYWSLGGEELANVTIDGGSY